MYFNSLQISICGKDGEKKLKKQIKFLKIFDEKIWKKMNGMEKSREKMLLKIFFLKIFKTRLYMGEEEIEVWIAPRPY